MKPNMLIYATAVLVSLWVFCPSAQSSQGSSTKNSFIQDKLDVVTIIDDHGGYVIDYMIRVMELRETKQEVRFAGRCDSACTLLLGLPKDQTCLGPGAYFRFHAPLAPTDVDAELVGQAMMSKYPSWVRTFINDHGGLTNQLVTMDFEYASRFVRMCA